MDSVPFILEWKGKYQQHQDDAERIAKVSRGRKEFTVGE